MSEEAPNGPRLNPDQLKGIEDFNIGGEYYTLKELVQIPEVAVTNWVNIPLTCQVTLNLTRGDLDRLYFSITQMSAATTMLSETVRLISFGDTVGANVAIKKTSELAQSADGNFRHFFAAVMKGAVPNG